MVEMRLVERDALDVATVFLLGMEVSAASGLTEEARVFLVVGADTGAADALDGIVRVAAVVEPGCFDLLVPHVGELAGGSVREERLDLLRAAMVSKGMDPDGERYAWYCALRQFGGAPHVGFGMGFERLVSWVGGIDNVRECIPMPRWAGRMIM